MANWNEFIASPLKASRQMHVSGRDVKHGAQLDELRQQRELAALRASEGYPSRENAERLPMTQAERNDELFRRALLKGSETSVSATPRTLGHELLDNSEVLRDIKEFYDARSPGGKRAMLAFSMLPAIAAPIALGASVPLRLVTGAALNTALGVPLSALEPDTYDPSRDAMYGAAFGASPLIGGAAIGADMLYQGAKGFAGGGSIAGAAKRLAQRAMPMFQEGAAPTMAPRGALSVVKPKGG